MKAFFTSTLNILILAVGIIGLLCILYAWGLPPFSSAIMTTDNAYVQGFVTTLAPEVDGHVAQVNVTDYQRVKKGELLLLIDDRIYRQKLNQAVAQLKMKQATLDASYRQEDATRAQIFSAQSAFERAKADWDRIQPLTKQGYQTQSQYDAQKDTFDSAQANLNVAQQNLKTLLTNREGMVADVENAQAALKLAQINEDYTRIYAPFDGRMGAVNVRRGQYVAPGTQLFAIVPDEVWITANYKENQLANMKIGQPVTFNVDALDHLRMTGYVERISPAAGAEFAVLKPDNATGNFTKIVQRIPVRIHINPNQPGLDRIAPGMSVETHVDTSKPGDYQITPNVPESN